MKLTISANTVSLILTLIISVLVIAHCIQAFFFLEGLIEYIGFLDLDIERNLPTFYSALAMEFCAILLCVIYVYHKNNHHPSSWAWLGLVIIFAFLGLDESTKIHENVGDLISPSVDASGALFYPWVIPYSIAITFIGIIYLPWLKQLPTATAIQFILSGIVFLSGALGMEMISAGYAEEHGTYSSHYTWTYTIEETLEMLGIMIFARALILYISKTIENITIQFTR